MPHPYQPSDEENRRLWEILLDPTTVLSEDDIMLIAKCSKLIIMDLPLRETEI